MLLWIERQALGIFPLTVEHVHRIGELMSQYSDLPMDLADSSLLVAAEEINTSEIVAIDSDYSVYRTKQGRMFTNLLAEHL